MSAIEYLCRELATIIEATGEDANGSLTTRETVVRVNNQSVPDEERRSSQGPLPANASTLVIANASDLCTFGSSWSVKPGDTVSVRGSIISVLAVSPQYNPRSGFLHHIEVTCG